MGGNPPVCPYFDYRYHLCPHAPVVWCAVHGYTVAMNTGEFYVHYGGDPYYNMAVDEWFFARVLAGPPALLARLYTWREEALTIGVNQKPERAVDLSRLGKTPLIRRITGGRALLHDPSELTYCVVFDLEAVGGAVAIDSPSAFYEFVAGTLVRFLGRLGFEVRYERRSAAQNSRPGFFHRAACFASNARYEVTSEGRKLVASAARQCRSVILQHGAIKIHGVAPHAALRMGRGVGAQSTNTPQPITAQALSSAGTFFREEISNSFGICLQPRSFSAKEEEEAARLVIHTRKNALGKRDSFEHGSHPVSLYRVAGTGATAGKSA